MSMYRLALSACLILGLGACASGQAARDGAGQVQDGFADAALAPLEDLNVRRDEIPIVLLQAQANPYDLRNMERCQAIAQEVRRLDDALGPDTDEPPSPDGRMMSERGADAAADLTLDAIRGTTTDLIPFRSWVRRLTGAEAHSRLMRESITAGRQRRSFLKGVGMSRNCAPPAAPSWFNPAPEPAPPPPPPRQSRRSGRR
ncbi:hypothetical protein Q0812_03850 [Brevundimonas sp. 2R-24]|uniref:Uncharacterized protein n=1 Tax=Peiella sedimenti TaxID=3061083 RepID=A0ABT8SKP9_9CAUL|nr:hypothetical protein [Caulobacteraceae bacterium XZ-24]